MKGKVQLKALLVFSFNIKFFIENFVLVLSDGTMYCLMSII